MKQVLATATLFLLPLSTAWADVDTLECNTAAAIRIAYAEASQSSIDDLFGAHSNGEICLVRDAPATVIDLGGYPISLRYVVQHGSPDRAATTLAAKSFSSEIVFTPDDLAGGSFIHRRMINKPHYSETDGDWRYTPLRMVLTEPTLFIFGGDG